jgi:hypothetical protein
VTARAAERRTAQQVLTTQYRRLCGVHPSYLLRWLRNGVMLCLAATALFYLWVATQADSDIVAANRTRQSLGDIRNASSAMAGAQEALTDVVAHEDVTLVGTGSEFVNRITQVNKYLTLAAEGNAAGAEGTAQIQYVQNQLASYLQLSENAVRDYSRGGPLGKAGMSYASGGQSDVQSAISSLYAAEQKALQAQRSAWALAPGTFWWALLGPVIGMLLLGTATVITVARHFRRHVSRWLWSSLLTVTAVTITVGFFNASDARSLPSSQWASHPATMTIALLMLAAAAVQAYLAYYPRLAEYRFQPT